MVKDIDLTGIIPQFNEPSDAALFHRTYWASFDRDAIARVVIEQDNPVAGSHSAADAVKDLFRPVAAEIARDCASVAATSLGIPWRDMGNWLGTRMWYPVYVASNDPTIPPQKPAPFSLGPLAAPCDPNTTNPESLFFKAIDLLSAGNYRDGLPYYEYRWMSDKAMGWWPDLEMPLWDGFGSPRLLVHTEQGYGDIIQFSRYLLELKQRGIKADLLIHPYAMGLTLARLLAPLGVRIVNRDHLDDYDAHIPICSLPLALGAFEPGGVGFMPEPYLNPRGDLASKWMERTTGDARRFIGICWAGNADHPHNADRSVTLPELLRYVPFDRDDILVSLQVGPTREQLGLLPADIPVLDFMEDTEDFADTAALMSLLEMVVTVDTSVAHLAGAMGIPTLLILGKNEDWRWSMDETASRWYPSVRLIRRNAGETTCRNTQAAAFAEVAT